MKLIHKKSIIKYFLILKFFLLFFSDLHASCIQPVLNNNWQSNLGNIEFIKTFTGNDGLPLKTRQGIEKFSFNNENLIASTSGYYETNSSIFDYSGNLKKNILLDDGTTGKLIADVASSNNALWWSSYRGNKIIRTSFNLDVLEVIDLPIEYGKNIIGLTYVPEINSIIFPSRTKNKGLVVLKKNLNGTSDINFFPTSIPLIDPYDIKYYDGCLFIVDRGLGQILTVNTKEIQKMNYKEKSDSQTEVNKIITTKVFAGDLVNPQHLDLIEDKLFIIETNKNQVVEYDTTNYVRTIYPLSDNKIYRGLSILENNIIALTGFLDVKDYSESRTGITLFKLDKIKNDNSLSKKEEKELKEKKLKLEEMENRLSDQSKALGNLAINYSKLVENSTCDFSVKSLTQSNINLKIDSFKKNIEFSSIKNYLDLPGDAKINGIFFDPKNLSEDINIIKNLSIKNLKDKAIIEWLGEVKSIGLDFQISITRENILPCYLKLRLHFSEEALSLKESDWKIVSVIGRSGLDLGAFSLPYGTQFYDGKLWTTDCSNENISIFSLDGKFLNSFGEYGTRLGQLDTPAAMKILNERIYVVEERNHRVQVLDLTGNTIDVFGAYTKVEDPFLHTNKLNYPLGIASDGKNLAVVDYGNNRIIGVNPEKGYRTEWVSGNLSDDEVFKWKGPYYAKWSKKGDYYVISNRGANEIVLLSSKGKKIRSLGKDLLNYPHEIDTDNDGNIYVADMKNNRVVIYSAEENFNEEKVNFINFPKSYGVPKTLTVLRDGLISVGFVANGSAYFLVLAPNELKVINLSSKSELTNEIKKIDSNLKLNNISDEEKTFENLNLQVRNIYSQYCASCHEKGNYGAPARGNIESWEKYPRDMQTLLQLAIQGKGAMIARGGCDECSDELLTETIKFMLPMNWFKEN